MKFLIKLKNKKKKIETALFVPVNIVKYIQRPAMQNGITDDVI